MIWPLAIGLLLQRQALDSHFSIALNPFWLYSFHGPCNNIWSCIIVTQTIGSFRSVVLLLQAADCHRGSSDCCHLHPLPESTYDPVDARNWTWSFLLADNVLCHWAMVIPWCKLAQPIAHPHIGGYVRMSQNSPVLFSSHGSSLQTSSDLHNPLIHYSMHVKLLRVLFCFIRHHLLILYQPIQKEVPGTMAAPE